MMGKEGVQRWGLNKNGRSCDASSEVMSCLTPMDTPLFSASHLLPPET